MIKYKSKNYLAIVISLLVVFGLLSLVPAQRWQGSFLQVEYRFIFLDRNKQPVRNVTLTVDDEIGNRSNDFPVTDFHGDNIKSDENGILIFHHLRSDGVELSGECHHLFFFIPLGQCQSPRYKCKFSLNSDIFYTIDFNELNSLARTHILSGREEVVVVPGKSFSWPDEPEAFDTRTKFAHMDQLSFSLLTIPIVIK